MSRDGSAALPGGATGCLPFVIVVIPDHTHLLFLLKHKNIVVSYAISYAQVIRIWAD